MRSCQAELIAPAAALIEGNYTGVTNGALGGFVAVTGSNVSASKLSGAFFDINKENYVTADSCNFALGSSFNVINIFGIAVSGTGVALTPEEAWNIDIKLDDGRPVHGSVLSTKKTCAVTIYCSTSDGLDATYDVQLREKRCVVRLKL